MWLQTSGCSHSFQIDSTWTKKRAATGISSDSTLRDSHTDSQISGMFSFLSSLQDTLFLPADFTKRYW